jgi:Flp pilus assembly protein TadG
MSDATTTTTITTPASTATDPSLAPEREPAVVTWSDDGGYVAAMTALLILPLMVFTAFAVDMGSWFGEATRLQRTADAASLAGVPFMPTFDSTVVGKPGAKQIAIETAKKNGYTNVDVFQKGANRIQVSINTTAPSFFAKAIGYNSQSLTRSAIAEFLNTIQMGSPEQYSGNDPDLDLTPNFWHNTAAYSTSKTTGDRYASGQCGGSSFGCNNTANSEFDPYGYIFNVTMPASVSGPIDIQVFDPATVNVGDQCGNSAPDDTQFATLQAQYNNNSAIRPSSDPNFSNFADRYKKGAYAANRWCSGDWVIGSNNTNSTDDSTKTTYIVREPDLTPLDALDNNPVCGISFDSYPAKGVLNNNIFNLLDRSNSANLANRGTERAPFWKHFRNWFSICRITNPIPGKTYIVQVSNNLSPISSPVTTASSVDLSMQTVVQTASVHNRYSMRAVNPSNPSANTGITVSSDTRFPIYTNTAANTNVDFYLARITPEYAGKTVKLSLWDIGDISGGGVMSMTIVPPADATNKPTTCTWGYNGGVNNTPGSITTNGCYATGFSGGPSNGSLYTANVDIPSNYTCDGTDPTKCWFHILINTTSSAQDTTTWSATVVGNPVHLVN